jgi:D-inositol-3-phosphate glycosyltransferase
LERLLADDSLRASMGNAARERAIRFGWPTIAADIIGVYRDLLGEKQQHADVC